MSEDEDLQASIRKLRGFKNLMQVIPRIDPESFNKHIDNAKAALEGLKVRLSVATAVPTVTVEVEPVEDERQDKGGKDRQHKSGKDRQG